MTIWPIWANISQMKDEFDRIWLVHVIDKVYSLIALAIRFGFPSWAAVKIAEALAGKTTLANVGIEVFRGYNFLGWLAALIIAVAITWALLERGLRKRKTVYFQRRIKRLEKQIDPNRSSSMLTEAGDTNPKDK